MALLKVPNFLQYGKQEEKKSGNSGRTWNSQNFMENMFFDEKESKEGKKL